LGTPHAGAGRAANRPQENSCELLAKNQQQRHRIAAQREQLADVGQQKIRIWAASSQKCVLSSLRKNQGIIRKLHKLIMRITAILLLAIASLPGPSGLTGDWRADLDASTLPAGFPSLRSQTMHLEQMPGKLRCVTERVTIAGTSTRAEFTAAFDGKHYPVTGIPEISGVSLHKYPEFIEADFFHDQTPVFSYRMQILKTDDSLIVVSIDPVTRKKLHARIVYRRQSAAR